MFGYPGFVICAFPDVWFILHCCLSARSVIYFVSTLEQRSVHHISSVWSPYCIFRIQRVIINHCERPRLLYSAIYEYCWRLLIAFSKQEINTHRKSWFCTCKNGLHYDKIFAVASICPPTTTKQKLPSFCHWTSELVLCVRRIGGLCCRNSEMNVIVFCESLYVKYWE